MQNAIFGGGGGAKRQKLGINEKKRVVNGNLIQTFN